MSRLLKKGSPKRTGTPHDFTVVARRVVELAIGEKLRSRKRARITPTAVALYFMHYNFGRVHQTLRVTAAMEAGISDHGWGIAEIIRLLES